MFVVIGTTTVDLIVRGMPALAGLGEHAAASGHYAASLAACRDYGDRWALAFLLEDIAVLTGGTSTVRTVPAALCRSSL